MGITGLIPLLKTIHASMHISKYAGQRVAIDAYVWLHRGAFGCAADLALAKPTTRFVDYCLERVRILRGFGVIPVLVLDGGTLPSKQHTEADRDARRKKNLEQGMSLYNKGDRSAALEYFQRCVDVTPDMAQQFILALRAYKVDYIVAPYEADAQIAYLARNDHVAAVITEDSDLLVYGCPNIIFKMDTHGNGTEIRVTEHLNLIADPSFRGWSHDNFRHLCILSGCDYLPSVTGMGLKKAHKFLQMSRVRNVKQALLFASTRGGLAVPKDYFDKFTRAELTFLHQRVYDPTSKSMVHLTDVVDPAISPEYLAEFLGPHLGNNIAAGIACGNLHPMTLQPYPRQTKPDPSWNHFTIQKSQSFSSSFVTPRPALVERSSSVANIRTPPYNTAVRARDAATASSEGCKRQRCLPWSAPEVPKSRRTELSPSISAGSHMASRPATSSSRLFQLRTATEETHKKDSRLAATSQTTLKKAIAKEACDSTATTEVYSRFFQSSSSNLVSAPSNLSSSTVVEPVDDDASYHQLTQELHEIFADEATQCDVTEPALISDAPIAPVPFSLLRQFNCVHELGTAPSSTVPSVKAGVRTSGLRRQVPQGGKSTAASVSGKSSTKQQQRLVAFFKSPVVDASRVDPSQV